MIKNSLEQLIPYLKERAFLINHDNISPASPCNLMNYVTEMHIGVRLCPYVISNTCRGMLILSETFGSCEELMGDKVIWTEEDLMGSIDDLVNNLQLKQKASFKASLL